MNSESMANKKNKKNRKNNVHKHIYQRKKLPQRGGGKGQNNDTQEKHADNNQQHMDADCDTNKPTLKGSRIINIDKLKQYTDSLTDHSARCGGRITLSGETRDGLASILTGNCSSCTHSITLETSQKVKGPRGYKRWECNLAAVWGQMTTGGGHSNLQETMGVVGVPIMTKTTFINTERDIGEWWKRELQDSMIEAGKEERQLAVEKGNYHEGVPAITVILDGGWSKRTHKHSYNAKPGVAIIIGKETEKILYIGVRNKYCAACARNIPKDRHTCYKNWTASSSEMETDCIVEGSWRQRLYTVFVTPDSLEMESALYIQLSCKVCHGDMLFGNSNVR